MTMCVHCIVSGRVQGVFYRAATQEKASELDLTGWVRNMPDGQVEVVACGDNREVQKLLDWLWQGPAHAEVSNVDITDIENESIDGFTVRD